MNTTTEEKKSVIPELFEIASQLPKKDLEHWIWLGKGIVFASKESDGK